MKNTIAFIVVGLALIGALFVFYSKDASAPTETPNSTPPPAQEGLPGMQTSDAPWKVELEHLRERLDAIGLPALAQEGMALHTHQHLDIYINGNTSMIIPAGIGMHQLENFISPIHAHAPDNIIHIESPEIKDFTLGQFFDIWGVRFTTDCIGGYCASDDKILRVFVNGSQIQGDPRQIKLEELQEIVITYGTEQEMPNPIPQNYPSIPGE
ncbi:MAG: hypothetical protein HYV65_03125 [Candidatus Spechtbacteria bacterium]|nr:hypothetical protein [Candidatus Spechtbacteria bacterium]